MTRPELGTYVRVTKTTAEMNEDNSYKGSFTKGDIAEVTRYDAWTDAFRLGDEKDVVNTWMDPEFIEVLEAQDITNPPIGSVWMALTDSKRGVKAGDKFEAVKSTCSCCESGFMMKTASSDDMGVRTYRDSYMPEMVKIADAPSPTVEDEASPLVMGTSVTTIVVDEVTVAANDDEATPPTLFKDMSDEEQGALLLAYFKGEGVQFYAPWNGQWVDEEDNIVDDYAYRLKPEGWDEARTAVQEAARKVIELRGATSTAERAVSLAKDAERDGIEEHKRLSEVFKAMKAA